MQDHIHFQIRDAARHFGISESDLYAMFRSVYGCTPIGIKHRILIGKSISLLATTDMTIETISEAFVLIQRHISKKPYGPE